MYYIDSKFTGLKLCGKKLLIILWTTTFSIYLKPKSSAKICFLKKTQFLFQSPIYYVLLDLFVLNIYLIIGTVSITIEIITTVLWIRILDEH